MLAWERFLGGGDCETCGPSYDEVTLERNFAGNTWELRVSVGCYHGGQAEGTASEIIDYVEDNWKHLLERHDLEDLKRVLENAKTQFWQFQLDPTDNPVEASGVLVIKRIDDAWEALLDACVDGGSEYSCRNGSWYGLRKWIHDEVGPEYLSSKQVDEVIARIEGATS